MNLKRNNGEIKLVILVCRYINSRFYFNIRKEGVDYILI